MKRSSVFAPAALLASALLATGVLATPAVSAPPPPPPWTVAASSAPPPSNVDFKMNAIGPAPQLTLTDLANSVTITCATSSTAGTTTTGTYASGVNLMRMYGNAFRANTCTDSVSASSFTGAGNGNWPFNALTYASGVTTGRFVSVSVKWSSSSCVFTMSGALKAQYVNATQRVRFLPPSSLTVSGVSGCAGIVNPGDALSVVVTYHLIPSMFTPITIT